LKKLVLVIAALVGLVVWSQPRAVHAASGPATLTVSKRVSASSEGVTQQTVPLAGARYQVTLIEAAGGAPIDAQNPSTYRAVTGADAMSVTLVTDAEGVAREPGLALNATYLVQELTGAGVTKAAEPVALVFNADHTAYMYTPKSGLNGTVPSEPNGTHRLPNTFEPVGNGSVRHTGDHILQTGGQYRLQGLGVLAVMAGLMLVVAVGAGVRRQRAY
jgi:hypothetical protein